MAAKVARNLNEIEERETIIERPPLPYLFEKEIVEKQSKHFWVVEEFIPIAVARKVRPIERKFYARHDQNFADHYERFERYTNLDSRYTKKCGYPRLESQVYGWLPNINRDDKLLHELNFIQAPKLRCDMTVYGESIISERVTERPSFYGLRFFLQ